MDHRFDDLLRAQYRLGGRDVATGIDCWGLVMAARARLGYATRDPSKDPACITGTAEDILAAFSAGWTMVAFDVAEPGDVVALPGFRGERTHAGVCIGGSPPSAMHITAKGASRLPWRSLRRHARGVWRNQEAIA